MLHLKASKDTGWSNKDLENATNQAINIPDSIDIMLHNINDYGAVSEIFLGKIFLLIIGLRSWLTAIMSELITYEDLAASNIEFIAQVFCSIDARVNCWLIKYDLKPIRCNVDDGLVCFDDM